jgi:glycosyltransferase involved in cell wall biosynthesis
MAAHKVLMVGPYPPPEGGWSTAIREEREELEARGIDCRVLNLGANRRVRSDRYIRVRNGADLFAKLLRFALSGYLFRLHMNGDSLKGMRIVLAASLICSLCLRRPCLSFHAGVRQRYFPHGGRRMLGLAWRVVFGIPKIVICDNDEVRKMIASYRRRGRGVYGVSPFSSRRVAYTPAALTPATEAFLSSHSPVIFSYFAYRPEYRIGMLFEAVRRLRGSYSSTGLLAVDDRSHPDPGTWDEARGYMEDEGLAGAVLATGEVGRDEFLTLMSRSDLHVRTPMTDGVCSSVLESLYLGVPVVAADNGSRPEGVVTYRGKDIDDMVSTIGRAIEGKEELRRTIGAGAAASEDSVARLADILEEEFGLDG